MASAYVNGIAQGSAGGAPPGGNPFSGANASSMYDPSKPWTMPSFMGGALGNGRDQKSGGVNWNPGTNNGVYWSDTGPSGAGYYQTQNPEQQLLGQQQYYTKQFNNNIPTMANQMYGQAASSINGQVNRGIQNTRQSNSSRGLLYSGINQGQEQGIRGQGAVNLSQAKSSINSGLINAGQQMQSSTVQSGISYQQMQQSLNDAIYSNAMQKLNGDTAMSNSLISSAATVGGIAAFA